MNEQFAQAVIQHFESPDKKDRDLKAAFERYGRKEGAINDIDRIFDHFPEDDLPDNIKEHIGKAATAFQSDHELGNVDLTQPVEISKINKEVALPNFMKWITELDALFKSYIFEDDYTLKTWLVNFVGKENYEAACKKFGKEKIALTLTSAFGIAVGSKLQTSAVNGAPDLAVGIITSISIINRRDDHSIKDKLLKYEQGEEIQTAQPDEPQSALFGESRSKKLDKSLHAKLNAIINMLEKKKEQLEKRAEGTKSTLKDDGKLGIIKEAIQNFNKIKDDCDNPDRSLSGLLDDMEHANQKVEQAIAEKGISRGFWAAISDFIKSVIKNIKNPRSTKATLQDTVKESRRYLFTEHGRQKGDVKADKAQAADPKEAGKGEDESDGDSHDEDSTTDLLRGK